MTITPAPITPAPPAGRRRVVWAAAIVVTVLVIVVPLSWYAVTQSALSGVRVTYDAQPLRCEGAEVALFPGVKPDGEDLEGASYELYFDDEFQRPLVELAPGMRCALRMQIVNDGWAEVRVTDVLLRFFGRGSGIALEAVSVSPNGTGPVPRVDANGFADTIDAAFLIDGGIGVPAEASQTFVAIFEYGDDTHMGECITVSANVPIVTFEALGRSASAQPSDDQSIAFRRPAPNGCD